MAVVSTTKLLQESHFFLQLLHYLEGLSWCCTDHFLVINLSYYSPFYLLQEYDFFENKRENNLEDLWLRSDPYNIKRDLLDNTNHGHKSCEKKCNSCSNFVVETAAIKCFATGIIFEIRRDSSCQTKNVIYVAYCLNCQKQCVGSTVCWKPRLKNYKSHI